MGMWKPSAADHAMVRVGDVLAKMYADADGNLSCGCSKWALHMKWFRDEDGSVSTEPPYCPTHGTLKRMDGR